MTLLRKLLLGCLAGSSLATFAWGADSAPRLSADIAPQPLARALAAFGRQTGLQLIYVSGIAESRRSNGARAGLTASAALTQLLDGTELKFEFLNERSVRIFQPPPSPPPSKPASSAVPPQTTQTPDLLQEILVTAFARQQSADRTPITLGVWTAGDLDAAGIVRLDELALQTAGAYFVRAARGGPGINAALFLRGLSQLTGDATVAVYIDGVPVHAHTGIATTWGDNSPLTFDLDRVEVLYGPQGMMGGDSAEAGAIRLVSRAPSLTDWSALVRSAVAVTEHGAPGYELGVALGGPITPRASGFRLSLWARTDGGYVDRVDPFTGQAVEAHANHASSGSARLAFTFAPTETVHITPSIIRQSVDLHDSPVFYDYLSNPGAGTLLNGKLVRQPADDTLYLGSLTATVDLPATRLTSITAYARRTMAAVNDTTNVLGVNFGGWGNPLGSAYPVSYLDAVPTTLDDKQTQLSQEIRLSSSNPTAPLAWLFGVWVAHAVESETSLTTPVDPGLVAIFDGASRISASTIETDLFGQLDVRLADRLHASAGARISHDQFETTALQSGPLNNGAPPSFDGRSRATTVAPRFDLTYSPESHGVLYLSIAKGYRLGGVNLPPVGGCDQPSFYNGDSTWSYEAGAKALSADESMQIDAAIFHVVFHDIVQQAYTDCGGTYLANAGAAASDGFDLSMRIEALKRLQLGASVEYADARYTQSVFVGPYTLRSGEALGVAPHVAPPWSGTAWIRALVSPTREPVASVRLDAAFRSHHPGPFFTQDPSGGLYAPGWRSDPATTLLNLRAEVSWSSFAVAAFVNNLLDSHPQLGHMSDTRNATLFYDVTFRPRTSGLEMSLRF